MPGCLAEDIGETGDGTEDDERERHDPQRAELVSDEALQQEAEDEEADAGERVELLSKAAKNIATLTRSSINLKEFQAKVEDAARRKLLEEQRAALEAMPNKGGVTADTKSKIREALGIV